MIEQIGVNDHTRCRAGEPCYAGRPVTEVPARDDRCTCSAAALELERLRGFLDALTVVSQRNMAQLNELLGHAREQHAGEGK